MMQSPTIPLMLLGPRDGPGTDFMKACKFDSADVPQVSARLRTCKRELLGHNTMYKAGYAPNAFVTFFGAHYRRTKSGARNDSEGILTHPRTSRPH